MSWTLAVIAQLMKKFAFIGGILMVLIFIAVALRHPRPPGVAPAQPTNLVVTFVGYTNTSAGSTQALFHFTNATPRSLHFRIMSLDSKTDSGWQAAPETPYNRLVGSLDSRIGFIWPVDVDATNTVWRVRVSCVEQATGVPGVVDRGKAVVNKIKTGIPTQIFTGRMYEILSSDSEK